MKVSEPKKVAGRKHPWQVRVTVNKKLTRRFFATYQEAVMFRDKTLETADHVGADNLVLDKSVAADYHTARSLLPEGYTLTQVVTDWVAGRGRTDRSGVSYVDALGRYWDHLESRNLARGTYGGYRHCHLNALAEIGDRDTAEDISRTLEQWFLDLINVRGYSWRTAKRHKAYLDGFYNWAVKERLTTDNWCRFVKFAREPRLEKVFLTAEETLALLRAAEELDPGLVNMMVLGLFAGLRAEEIREGQGGEAVLPWEHIHFHEQTIYVEKAKAAAGNINTQRYVEGLPGNIWFWLDTYGHHQLELKNWRKRLQVVTDAAGVNKRMNSLFRKSFATHAVPLQGAGITAVQMGHTGPSTTQKHYRGLVTKVEAQKYFDIVPRTRTPVREL